MSEVLTLKKYPDSEVFLISGDVGSNLILSEVPSFAPAKDVLPAYLQKRGRKYASLGYGCRMINDGNGEESVAATGYKEYHWFDSGLYETIRDTLNVLGVDIVEVTAEGDDFPPIYYYESWNMPGSQEAGMGQGYLTIPENYQFMRSIYEPITWDQIKYNGWRSNYPTF